MKEKRSKIFVSFPCYRWMNLSQRSISLSPPIEELDDAEEEGGSSRFSTSVSSSEDNWSLSDEDQPVVISQELGNIIGRGAFGTVYKSVWKGQIAAIKVILIPSSQEVSSTA